MTYKNSSDKTTTDTLHWTAFNIPGAAKGSPEGLTAGDLPDGTRNGPGIAARNGKAPAYFGPGAGPGPRHHYVFELRFAGVRWFSQHGFWIITACL